MGHPFYKHNTLMYALMPIYTTIDLLTAAAAIVLSGSLLAPYMDQFKSVPLVNTTLVFLEKNKEVFLPIVNATKQAALVFSNMALAFAKPVLKLLVLVLRTLKPFILFGLNVTRIAIHQARDAGVSVGLALKNAGEKIWDFGSSLAIVMKALAQATAYIMKGLSVVINSFDSVFQTGYRILFHTSQVTWNEISSAFIPLIVVTLVLGTLYWMKRSKTPTKSCDETPILRRSSRIARKRSIFSCADVSAPAFAGEKSSATNL